MERTPEGNKIVRRKNDNETEAFLLKVKVLLEWNKVGQKGTVYI